jgi:hypothetical protein
MDSIAGGREQSLALPKTDVSDTKLYSACCVVPRRELILADAQKKVKRHDYKVCRRGLARRGVRVITSGRGKVNGVYRKRYLGFGSRVAHPEGLKEVGKGISQVGAGAGSSGIGVSFQHKGLGHVTQGFFSGLGSNLPTFPKESSKSSGGKVQEKLAADRGRRVAQSRICSTIGTVLFEITLESCGLAAGTLPKSLL